jgi:hypothetical protein
MHSPLDVLHRHRQVRAAAGAHGGYGEPQRDRAEDRAAGHRVLLKNEGALLLPLSSDKPLKIAVIMDNH